MISPRKHEATQGKLDDRHIRHGQISMALCYVQVRSLLCSNRRLMAASLSIGIHVVQVLALESDNLSLLWALYSRVTRRRARHAKLYIACFDSSVESCSQDVLTLA
jgi:hypothetical protein